MFCLKCGELIPDDCTFCPKCGEKVSRNVCSGAETPTQVLSHDDSSTVVVGIVSPNVSETQSPNKKKKSKVLIGAISAIIIIAIVIFSVQAVGKANLKKQLLRDWQRTDSELLLELDFSDDEIEYNAYTGITWMDTTISTMKYKVISPNKIKIEDYDMVIEIEFNDDKTMMTCTPAITSTDTDECWFNLD